MKRKYLNQRDEKWYVVRLNGRRWHFDIYGTLS